jgi:hypothetical protein
MEIILTILGLFGIPTIYFGIRYLLFNHNVEFHKILKSFPLISENKLNNGNKTTTDLFTNIQISKEFTEFVDIKRVDLDEFLAKLERFDTSKLIFKKKEITSFVNNIKRLLTSKASNIQIDATIDINTGKVNTIMSGESIEWSAFNYIMVYNITKEQKNIDKLYVCKILNF